MSGLVEIGKNACIIFAITYLVWRMGKQNKSGNLRLHVYRSFDEAAEAEALEAASKPPLERIRETVALILRTYNVTEEQLKARRKKWHINIIRYK
jgi:hypothetical protein